MGEREKEQNGAVDGDTVQLAIKGAKDLIRSLEGTATSRVVIRAGALQIEVERAGGVIVQTSAVSIPVSPTAPPTAPPTDMAIVAPVVGVFYRAGSPGAKPFVEVGDRVERGDVVGIVEAMKQMNEVASDYRGIVKEILVENGTAVQFEQPLMLIDTAGGGSE